jgi:hypothetical protein
MHTLALTATASGIDGFLYAVAALAFLVAAIFAFARPGHRMVLVLIAAGLLLWVLTGIVK